MILVGAKREKQPTEPSIQPTEPSIQPSGPFMPSGGYGI